MQNYKWPVVEIEHSQPGSEFVKLLSLKASSPAADTLFLEVVVAVVTSQQSFEN